MSDTNRGKPVLIHLSDEERDAIAKLAKLEDRSKVMATKILLRIGIKALGLGAVLTVLSCGIMEPECTTETVWVRKIVTHHDKDGYEIRKWQMVLDTVESCK